MADSFETLLQVLQDLGKPAGLADLKAQLNIPERTLSRWLVKLIETGQVQVSGEKRRRYWIQQEKSDLAAPPAIHPLFSPLALARIQRVRQPLVTRDPCTYNLNWLDAYQPNQTFYLSATQRQLLMQQGKQASAELPAGTYAQHIFNRLLIDLSYNSSRLEGNTYSLLDTEKLLLEGVAADNKLDAEKIMLLNHKEAIRFLVNGINRMDISIDNIRSLHYLLADGLVLPDAAGQIRSDPVRISATTYMPMDDKYRLEQQLALIARKARAIVDPFEQSFFLLVHIAYLQAFIDVNKRTARLACNIPLIRHNLAPLSFNDIDKDDYASAVIVTYEQNDVSPLAELYIGSYLRSCKLYRVTIEAMGIDPIRVQYRPIRREMIRAIVQNRLHAEALQVYIQAQANERIPEHHRAKFMTDLQTDIANLAPFSIAGMGITQGELLAWQHGLPK